MVPFCPPFCQHPEFFYLLEEFNNNNRIAADNFYYSRDLVTHKFARISAQEMRKRTTIEWIYTRDPREHPGINHTTYSDLYREGQVCWKNRDVEKGSSLFRLQRSHIDRRVTVMRSTPVRWPLALRCHRWLCKHCCYSVTCKNLLWENHSIVIIW